MKIALSIILFMCCVGFSCAQENYPEKFRALKESLVQNYNLVEKEKQELFILQYEIHNVMREDQNFSEYLIDTLRKCYKDGSGEMAIVNFCESVLEIQKGNDLLSIELNKRLENELIPFVNDSTKVGAYYLQLLTYVLINEGLGLSSLKDYTSALACFRKAHEIMKSYPKMTFNMTLIYENMGTTYLEAEELDSAYFYLNLNRQEVMSNNPVIDQYSLFYHYLGLTKYHLKTYNLDSTEFFLDSVEHYARDVEGKFELLRLKQMIGECHDDFKAVVDNGKAYIDLIEHNEIEQNDKELEVLNSIARAYSKMKMYKEANQYFLFAFEMQENRYNSEVSGKIIELSKINDLRVMDANLKLLKSNNQELKEQNTEEQNRSYRRGVLLCLGGLLILVFVLIVVQSKYRINQKNKLLNQLKTTTSELESTRISKKEKETLLKEIHHRVKNNLQIVISLLRLQSFTVTEERYLKMLKDCENRISAMSLLHESLYMSEDLSEIEVSTYIKELIRSLISTYTVEKEVKFKAEIDIDYLGLDTLVPLGLILNEIVTNALKYGTVNNPDPYVFVKISKTKDAKIYKMIIGDNGQGLRDGVDLKKSDTLGVELIESLVEQLDGEYSIDGNNGVVYTILFKDIDIDGFVHQ